MRGTANYGWALPEENDAADVEVLNAAFEAADAGMKGQETRLDGHDAALEAAQTALAAETAARQSHESDGGRHITAAERAVWDGKASPSVTASVTLTAAGWTKDATRELWTQPVRHAAVADGMQISLAVDDGVMALLQEGGITLKVDNDSGAATAKAFGSAPETDIVVQMILTKVVGV